MCTLVPSQPGAHPLAGLETVPAQTAYGLVWACLGEPYLPMPSIPEMADDPDDGWETGFGAVRGALRPALDHRDFRDSSHFAFVPQAGVRRCDPAVPAYEVRRDGWTLGWEFVLRYAQEWQVDDGADTGERYRFGGSDVDQAHPSVSNEQLIHYRF